MPTKPSDWQPILQGEPQRPRRRIMPDAVEPNRGWFKMRTVLGRPVVIILETLRRRQWREHLYPALFFASFKSIKTIGWFPHLPAMAVYRRFWPVAAYPSFWGPHLVPLLGAGTVSFVVSPTDVLSLWRPRRRDPTSWFGIPKLGAKTRPCKDES